MSKPRLKIQAIIDTEAHADTIISAIRNRLVGKDIFEEHSLRRFENELVCDVRFNSRIDRDDVKTWIRDQVQTHPQIKDWVRSVSVIDHLCTHDDDVKDCNTTEYVRWERV